VTRIALTMDVSAHVIPEMQAEAAETFGQLLFGPEDGCVRTTSPVNRSPKAARSRTERREPHRNLR
jgi:hypothetical protein